MNAVLLNVLSALDSSFVSEICFVSELKFSDIIAVRINLDANRAKVQTKNF